MANGSILPCITHISFSIPSQSLPSSIETFLPLTVPVSSIICPILSLYFSSEFSIRWRTLVGRKYRPRHYLAIYRSSSLSQTITPVYCLNPTSLLMSLPDDSITLFDHSLWSLQHTLPIDGRPLRYLMYCPPSQSRPVSCPHIVDDSDFPPDSAFPLPNPSQRVFVADLRLCDGIATTLWNFDKAAFLKFFDRKIRFFEFRNIAWASEFGCMHPNSSLIVRRHGDLVTVCLVPLKLNSPLTNPSQAGVFDDHTTHLKWDFYVHSLINFPICSFGNWVETYGLCALHRPTTPTPVPGSSSSHPLWQINPIDAGVLNQSPIDQECARHFGRLMAFWMLSSKV